jgi:competence protein ComEC
MESGERLQNQCKDAASRPKAGAKAVHLLSVCRMLPTLRPRLPLLGLAVAAVVGIEAAEFWIMPVPPLLGAGFLLLALCWVIPRTAPCLAFTATVFAALHSIEHQKNAGRELESALIAGPRVATASGVVISEPERLPYFSKKRTGTFRLRLDRLEIAESGFECGSKLAVTWSGPLPVYGDRVRIRGSLQPLEIPRNPGEFDYADYLRRQGIFASLDTQQPQDCVIEGRGAGNPLIAMGLKSRRWMQTQLALDLEDSPEVSALIASMVLGARGETSEDVKDLFRRTGTLHLFAVSGLNVAMLGVIVWHLLKPFGIRRTRAVIIIIPVMAFYAVVTGLGSSCVRAAVMASIVLLGELLERRPSVLNSLAAAALVILAWDTNELFSPGFRFSFVLVAVIVLVAHRVQRFVEPLGQPDPFLPRPLWNLRQRWTSAGWRVVAGAIAVTVSAWLGSLPFTAGYFHLFSASAIVANLFAVPLAFSVLTLGLLTLLTVPAMKGLAVIFSNANWGCTKLLLVLVELFAEAPGGYQYVELPSLKRTPAAEITALDVADGGAIHLRSRNVDWLIDGGSARRYERITLPYLRSRGVNQLSVLLLTHGDAQHVGGAKETLDDFAPCTVLDTPLKDRSTTRRKFHAELAARGLGKGYISRGDVLTCGDAAVRVLYPAAGMTRSTSDDKALVIRIECEGQRILLMSDSGFSTESWLIENEPDLRADVLIKGHHSKDLSGTPEFLSRVAPQAVIVSALKYGELPETLDPWTKELEDRGIAVFRQDRCGAVNVKIRDLALEVSGFVNAQRFRSRAE